MPFRWLFLLIISVIPGLTLGDYVRYGAQYGDPTFLSPGEYCTAQAPGSYFDRQANDPNSVQHSNVFVGYCKIDNSAIDAAYARMYSGVDPDAPCPDGQVINPDTGECVEPDPCQDLYYTSQSPDAIGDCPAFCYQTDQGEVCGVYDSEPWSGPDGDSYCAPLGDGTEGSFCVDADTQSCITGTPDGWLDKPDCYSQESECVYRNGRFSCLEPQEQNCGYFNGEQVCVDETGNVIPSDSPDHPKNGGNADGDNTNDPTDPRKPEEGGDPNNQPGVIIPTTDDNRAQETTQRDVLNETRKGNDILRDIEADIEGLKTDMPENADAQQANKIETEGDAQIEASGIDGLIQNIADNPIGTGEVDSVAGTILGMIPKGSCGSVSMEWGGHALVIDCDDAQPIRDILGWILYLFTAWYLFDLMITPVGAKP